MSGQQQANNEVPPTTWDEVFKHPRFAQLNQRAKEAEKALADLQKAQGDAETARLAEEKKWQDLAAKYKEDLAKVQGQVESERVARLRLEIGTKTGLPLELANLLTGKDEAEMTVHAQTLLPLIKPATPGVPPAPNRQPVESAFTVEQLNDPKFVRENAAKIWQQTGQA